MVGIARLEFLEQIVIPVGLGQGVLREYLVLTESRRDLSAFSDSSWIAAIAASLKRARSDPNGLAEVRSTFPGIKIGFVVTP